MTALAKRAIEADEILPFIVWRNLPFLNSAPLQQGQCLPRTQDFSFFFYFCRGCPYACREVDVTPKNKNNFFKPSVRTSKGPKLLQIHFDTDLCPFISFLKKRNSNSCSKGFKISVDKLWSEFSWKKPFCRSVELHQSLFRGRYEVAFLLRTKRTSSGTNPRCQ